MANSEALIENLASSDCLCHTVYLVGNYVRP